MVRTRGVYILYVEVSNIFTDMQGTYVYYLIQLWVLYANFNY